jgi:hypothetical protein
MALRALIAALLIPALGAGATFGVLHAMAAYTGAGLEDVLKACAPDRLTLFLSPECEPVQPHYWLILGSAATATAGLVLILLCALGGRTELSVFSFRGLIAAPIVTAHGAIIAATIYLAEAQWQDRVPAVQLLGGAALVAGLGLWLLAGALRLRADE